MFRGFHGIGDAKRGHQKSNAQLTFIRNLDIDPSSSRRKPTLFYYRILSSEKKTVLPMRRLFSDLVIENPKRDRKNRSGRASWYTYYASFSDTFAHVLIKSAGLDKDSTILDPWNGNGTTTTAGSELGYRTRGYDLNPVMVITAKARLLSKRETPSLMPLCSDIAAKSVQYDSGGFFHRDPLRTWLSQRTADGFRNLEKAIQILLVDSSNYESLEPQKKADRLSGIAAFFYTALFRTLRHLLRQFVTSNPTWIKRPKTASEPVDLALQYLLEIFMSEVAKMRASIADVLAGELTVSGDAVIAVGTSQSLPLPDDSIGLFLSSPPYCTRIDYAVATMPELALLGYRIDGDFQELRRQLIGTSTVPALAPRPSRRWGSTCMKFLEQLRSHNSKASKSYYFKNHVQYFAAIFSSFAEIERTLASNGLCVLVVQDSYYKDIHNDLPLIFTEMATAYGLELVHRSDFQQRRTMASINPAVRRYRSNSDAIESVLCFVK